MSLINYLNSNQYNEYIKASSDPLNVRNKARSKANNLSCNEIKQITQEYSLFVDNWQVLPVEIIAYIIRLGAFNIGLTSRGFYKYLINQKFYPTIRKINVNNTYIKWDEYYLNLQPELEHPKRLYNIYKYNSYNKKIILTKGRQKILPTIVTIDKKKEYININKFKINNYFDYIKIIFDTNFQVYAEINNNFIVYFKNKNNFKELILDFHQFNQIQKFYILDRHIIKKDIPNEVLIIVTTYHKGNYVPF